MSRREQHKRSRELIQQRKRDEARAVMRSLEGLEGGDEVGHCVALPPLAPRTNSPRPFGERATAQPAGEGVGLISKPLTPPSPQGGEGAGINPFPAGEGGQRPGEGLNWGPSSAAARHLLSGGEGRFRPLSAEGSHSNDIPASFGPDQTAQQSEIPLGRPGPRTVVGKAAARGNAVKHGLSGAGKEMPEDMRIEVEKLEAAFREDFPPSTATESQAVFNMALGAVRMERCFQLEIVLTERNRVRDLAKFDLDRQLAAERLGQKLLESPAETVLELRSSVAGCTWLITRWQRLLNGLQNGTCLWQEADVDRACALLGTPRAEWHLDLGTTLVCQTYELVRGTDRERAARALVALQRRVAEEIAHLEQDSNAILTHDMFDRTLLERNLRFDTSPEVQKVWRLEADASRLFYRSFQFMKPRYRASKEGPAETREPYASSYGGPYSDLHGVWDRVRALLAQTEARSVGAAQNECAPAQNECAPAQQESIEPREEPAIAQNEAAPAQNESPGAQNESRDECAEVRDETDQDVGASLRMSSVTFPSEGRPRMAIAAQVPPMPEPLTPALASRSSPSGGKR